MIRYISKKWEYSMEDLQSVRHGNAVCYIFKEIYCRVPCFIQYQNTVWMTCHYARRLNLKME